ncbi:MAG: hypothetical protein WDZ31_02015 [Phycisphaeraceae bacterium]
MQRTSTLLAVLSIAGLTLLGCDQQQPPAEQDTASPDAHAHEDHEAHDHHEGESDGGVHGGPKHELGSTEVGPYAVTVTQVGAVEAGGPGTFEIVLDDEAAAPEAIRAWVGNEQAVGSVKVRAVDRGDFFDADLQVPDPMPEESRLWVEIQTDDGQRHTGSLDLQ